MVGTYGGGHIVLLSLGGETLKGTSRKAIAGRGERDTLPMSLATTLLDG